MLQNLCRYVQFKRNPAVVTIAHQSPPLSKHLRLAGVGAVAMDFAHDLPNGIGFRSVELEEFSGVHAQHVLNMCASTLQSLRIAPHGSGTNRFRALDSQRAQFCVVWLFAYHSPLRPSPHPVPSLARSPQSHHLPFASSCLNSPLTSTSQRCATGGVGRDRKAFRETICNTRTFRAHY